MDEPTPRFWEIFFEVYEELPRQGPGDRASAERALALCGELPLAPRVVDLGCGVGAQTLHLAELTAGTIVALDSHAPAIARLRARLAERGMSDRVEAVVADMAEPGLPAGGFDLVWSEGALYNLGIPRALEVCRELLRPGGLLAFTDAVWRVDEPPAEVKVSFDFDYPGMGRVPDVIRAIDQGGFELLGHFMLPDEAWWAEFYTPMAHRIDALRERYATDAEALTVLAELAREPELHRRHGDTYGYAFFVARRR